VEVTCQGQLGRVLQDGHKFSDFIFVLNSFHANTSLPSAPVIASTSV
jgi:hypothetical protein